MSSEQEIIAERYRRQQDAAANTRGENRMSEEKKLFEAIKAPAPLAALILGIAAVVVTVVALWPVYQCTSRFEDRQVYVCLHGHHPG